MLFYQFKTKAVKPATAIKTALGIVAGLCGLHLSILFGLVPYDIVWGGRLGSKDEMYAFETFALGMNLFFGWLLLMKGRYTRTLLPARAVSVALWGFFVLFAFNTFTNLLAKTSFEQAFAGVTLLLCVLIWRVNRVPFGTARHQEK